MAVVEKSALVPFSASQMYELVHDIANYIKRGKLWDAFDERYGTSPARLLRTWGLAQARERLLKADPRATTVLDVANGLGFHHAGRFASRYRQMFGESPSRTLHAAS